MSRSRAELCIAAAEAALETENSLLADEVQLYAGIPFCPSKCAYCSFVSNDMVRWGHLIAPYHSGLIRETEAAGTMLRREGRRIGSVYIGGGTPTTLTADQLDSLIGSIKMNFDLSACREFTVEAGRPETITYDKLKVLADHGISRISINPQTMNDRVLENVGRKHTVASPLRIAENSPILSMPTSLHVRQGSLTSIWILSQACPVTTVTACLTVSAG